MAKKPVEKKVEDDPRYHDTWRLLKKYRDVVWSLELSVQQLKKQFEVEYGSSIEDFLESVYWPAQIWAARRLKTTPAALSGATRCFPC